MVQAWLPLLLTVFVVTLMSTMTTARGGRGTFRSGHRGLGNQYAYATDNSRNSLSGKSLINVNTFGQNSLQEALIGISPEEASIRRAIEEALNRIATEEARNRLAKDEALIGISPEETLNEIVAEEANQRFAVAEALIGIVAEAAFTGISPVEALFGISPDLARLKIAIEEALKGIAIEKALNRLAIKEALNRISPEGALDRIAIEESRKRLATEEALNEIVAEQTYIGNSPEDIFLWNSPEEERLRIAIKEALKEIVAEEERRRIAEEFANLFGEEEERRRIAEEEALNRIAIEDEIVADNSINSWSGKSQINFNTLDRNYLRALMGISPEEARIRRKIEKELIRTVAEGTFMEYSPSMTEEAITAIYPDLARLKIAIKEALNRVAIEEGLKKIEEARNRLATGEALIGISPELYTRIPIEEARIRRAIVEKLFRIVAEETFIGISPGLARLKIPIEEALNGIAMEEVLSRIPIREAPIGISPGCQEGNKSYSVGSAYFIRGCRLHQCFKGSDGNLTSVLIERDCRNGDMCYPELSEYNMNGCNHGCACTNASLYVPNRSHSTNCSENGKMYPAGSKYFAPVGCELQHCFEYAPGNVSVVHVEYWCAWNDRCYDVGATVEDNTECKTLTCTKNVNYGVYMRKQYSGCKHNNTCLARGAIVTHKDCQNFTCGSFYMWQKTLVWCKYCVYLPCNENGCFHVCLTCNEDV